MDWLDWLLLVVRVVVVFFALLIIVMLLVWVERKVDRGHADAGRARCGPGPRGILITLADGDQAVLQGGHHARRSSTGRST